MGLAVKHRQKRAPIDVRLMRSHSQRDEKSISGHRSSREQQSTHVNQRVNISAGCFKDARDLCAAAVIRTTGNYSPARTTLLESARILPTLNCIKHSARRSADDLSLIDAVNSADVTDSSTLSTTICQLASPP